MTQYYASPGGLDGANGLTTTTPVKTISKAIDLATTNGDVINLMAGDYASVDSNAGGQRPRVGIIIQNHSTDVVTVSRAHGGTLATNAGVVMDFKGWSSCTIRRNPLGGSLTIRHTGTPVAQTDGYLYVGNANKHFSGIRFTTATGATINNYNRVEDVTIGPIFGSGIRNYSGDNLTVLRCYIHDVAVGIWTNADSPTIQDCDIADAQYMLVDGPAADDTGANGIQLDGATKWTVSNNDIHGCWSRTGSQQYGAEGGAVEYYNIPTGQGGATVGNRMWDNHNCIETGADTAASSGGGATAELAYNIITGRNDYQTVTAGITQAAGGVSGSSTPTGSTSFLLVRALRDTWIHHNTWDVDDGSPGGAGIRTQTGGTFGGEFTGNTVENNIFYVRFGTPVYNFNGTGIPTGWIIRNNLIRYVASRPDSDVTFSGDYTGNVFASTGTANDYVLAATASGGASVPAADVSLCGGDVWGDLNTNAAASDPKFVDPNHVTDTLRDYHLRTGSAAIGMAFGGGDVGRYPYVAPPAGALFTEVFTRTVASGWGTNADTGRTYTELGTARMAVDGTRGTMLPNAVQIHYAIDNVFSLRDVTVRGEVALSSLPIGADYQIMPVLRSAGADTDWVTCSIRITPAGVVQYQFLRRVASAQTSILGPTSLGLATYTANAILKWEAKATGASPTTLSLKVWYSTDSEPGTAQGSTTDSTGSQVAGGIGFRLSNNTTTTPWPTLYWDNISVPSVTGNFAASVVADVNVVADLAVSQLLAASVAASATVSGSITVGRTLEASITVAATVTADLLVTTATALSATITASATISATLAGFWTGAWTTAFVAPEPVGGLLTTVDATDSLVTLTWDATALSPAIFDSYIVERQVGDEPWTLAGTVTDPATPTFVDHAAPTGILVSYRVKVSIGSPTFDSAPLEAELTTPAQWAVVVPGDETLTEGGLYIKAGATETEPWDVGFPRPLGRAYPLVYEEPRPLGRIGRVWSVSIDIMPTDRTLADKIFAWQRQPVIFKSDDGWVGWVRISGWGKTYQRGGAYSGSFTATETGP